MADYPLKFPKCPNCGCEITVLGEIVEEEKAAGRLPKTAALAMLEAKAVVFDANTRSILTVRTLAPAVIAYCDICTRCGTVYAFAVARGMAQIAANPNMPSNQQPHPFIGQG